MSGGIWGTTFASAELVASEVEKEVLEGDFKVQPSKKRHADDTSEIGAFSQPRKLAKFVKEAIDPKAEVINGDGLEANMEALNAQCADAELEKPSDESASYQQLSLEERCAKQTCRKWLKFTFLAIGKACNQNPCSRLHELPSNPLKLYQDFAFKGLPPAQQKRILASCNSSKTD